MSRILSLVRHGRASGQAPDADLLPEGEAYLERLAALLVREGWRPAAAATSPYRRAQQSARVLLVALATGLEAVSTRDLTPEADPDAALATLRALSTPEGRLLVVSHLPLVGRLAFALTGEEVEFLPGTLAEFELDGPAGMDRLLRRIGPDDLT